MLARRDFINAGFQAAVKEPGTLIDIDKALFPCLCCLLTNANACRLQPGIKLLI
jgi:hypothetical protein